MITEFGFPVRLERNLTLAIQQNDLPRSLYYESYLTDMLNVIHENGVNIIRTIALTMLDNWEWGSFKPHFGTQDQTTTERAYKRSFFDYVEFFHAYSGQALRVTVYLVFGVSSRCYPHLSQGRT